MQQRHQISQDYSIDYHVDNAEDTAISQDYSIDHHVDNAEDIAISSSMVIQAQKVDVAKASDVHLLGTCGAAFSFYDYANLLRHCGTSKALQAGSFSACAPILGEVESLRVDLHGLEVSPTENAALVAKKETEIGVLTRVLSMNASFNDAAKMKEEVFAMQLDLVKIIKEEDLEDVKRDEEEAVFKLPELLAEGIESTLEDEMERATLHAAIDNLDAQEQFAVIQAPANRQVTPKKNGKWRVCVDYKPLNAATKKDHFPLPFQDEILNEVAGHERYTVCDGYLGYYQIRIAEEDQHKTTFITPWGCFAFRVMPFGLTNAPSTFTRFTSFIFQPFFGKSIRVFLDDFCTYNDRALHCQRVEEGLQRLYQYGGQLNPDKCHVAEKEVVLLGHVISQEGIKVDSSRVQAILDLPPPNSAQQVITFVQKVRYMSRFIHFLSQLANQGVFSWEQEHLECFNEVKEVLGSLPTIMPPDPQGTYYLCPSVGLDAFGAVLMQKDPKTAYMRPIYFTSKVMTQRQKGYTDIEQLVFSLIVTIKKFRSYLLPKPFIILTLEHNLPYAIQHMSISSKISKWVLELQEYEYTFIVEDSTRASLADVLTYKVKEKKISSPMVLDFQFLHMVHWRNGGLML
ncbi:hypothetical protein L7F22_020148 [Adiantum nelumboides]|nr:hypothetical protein [Adiantum nelumboides]